MQNYLVGLILQDATTQWLLKDGSEIFFSLNWETWESFRNSKIMPLIYSGSFSLLSFLPPFFLSFPLSFSFFFLFHFISVPDNIYANGRAGTGDCLEGPQLHGWVRARHQEAAIQALAPTHICWARQLAALGISPLNGTIPRGRPGQETTWESFKPGSLYRAGSFSLLAACLFRYR